MCLFPISIKLKDGTVQKVPCRTCTQCLRSKFSTYLAHAMSCYNDCTKLGFFITLTYEPDAVHYVNERMNLCYKDVQDFMKRVRKDFKFKYVLCGEYGTKRQRPHYHILMFLNGIESIPSDFERNFSKYIARKWNKGFVKVEKIKHTGCISYVMKYISKPYLYPKAALKELFVKALNDPEFRSVYKHKFNLDNHNHQRKVLKHFGIVPQFNRRSNDMLLPIVNSDYVRFINKHINITIKKYYEEDFKHFVDNCKNFDIDSFRLSIKDEKVDFSSLFNLKFNGKYNTNISPDVAKMIYKDNYLYFHFLRIVAYYIKYKQNQDYFLSINGGDFYDALVKVYHHCMKNNCIKEKNQRKLEDINDNLHSIL